MGIGSGGMGDHSVSRLDKRSWICLTFLLWDLNPSCSLGHTNPKPCCPDAEVRARYVKVVDRESRGVREPRVGPTVWRQWQLPGQFIPGSNDNGESHTSQGNCSAPWDGPGTLSRTLDWPWAGGLGSIFLHMAVSELLGCVLLHQLHGLCVWAVPALRPP